MKKLVVLCLVAAAAFAVWKFAGRSSVDDPLAELQSRLDAAERSYQSAGRASAMSGLDSTGDAEAALAEVGRIEKELREMSRTATSEELKIRIRTLLDRAVAIRHRMG